MQVTIYYVFVPTSALAQAARLSKLEQEVNVAVWSDVESDRTGRPHSREAVERSFWNVFMAQRFCDEPESDRVRQFRTLCLDLGLHGCWSIHETRSGGPVSELVQENATEAVPFLAQRSINVDRSK